MKKMIKKIKISKKNWMIIILSIITIMMLLLNILTPLIADDFSYSFGVNNKRVENVIDIYNFQVWHYLHWGGRTIAHTIAQLFLLMPKWIFSICNTLVFTGTVYLMYLHARGKREDNPVMLLATYLILWFLHPVFGETFLWLTGSCNYLWTSFIILLFLLPFRLCIDKKDNILMICGMFLLGVLSGWTNENSAVGLLVISILFVVMRKLLHKKDKIRKWNISGILGALCGFIIMIVAPGNYVRKGYVEENASFIANIIRRILRYSCNLIEYLLPLIIVIVVVLSIYIFFKKKTEILSYIYLIGAFFSVYSMVLSPQFPERAWTGVIIFAVIGAVSLSFEVEKMQKVYNFIIMDILIILGVMYLNDYLHATADIYNLNSVWRYRNEYILEERKTNKNIIVDSYYPFNSKNPNYGLGDITADEENWINKIVARYYEIDTIKILEGNE